MKLSPVALPTDRKIPKPPYVLKVPSPRKPKLRASPDSSRPATLTMALTEPNRTSSPLALAPVFSEKPRALRVANWPSWTLSVSIWSWKESMTPPLKVSWARNASVFTLPSGLTSSAVVRSTIDAVKALPGKSVAPPVAM